MIVLSAISKAQYIGNVLHTCLSITDDSHIFKTLDMIVLLEFQSDLFKILVESRP